MVFQDIPRLKVDRTPLMHLKMVNRDLVCVSRDNASTFYYIEHHFERHPKRKPKPRGDPGICSRTVHAIAPSRAPWSISSIEFWDAPSSQVAES